MNSSIHNSGTTSSTNHTIVVNVGVDGKITSEVQGVAGPSCSKFSEWLNELGSVERDEPTDDFRKPPARINATTVTR